jgi:hypothetical protein
MQVVVQAGIGLVWCDNGVDVGLKGVSLESDLGEVVLYGQWSRPAMRPSQKSIPS